MSKTVRTFVLDDVAEIVLSSWFPALRHDRSGTKLLCYEEV